MGVDNSEVYHGIESGITALESLGRDVTHIFDRMIISATPVIVKGRQEYALEKQQKQINSREASFVEIKIKDTNIDPCYLITDWKVDHAFIAQKIARMYLQRWAVEDCFKFIKQALGFESVQLLKLEAVRNLLALAAVAASYLYYNATDLDWPEVELLARLGGWQYKNNSPPGKIVITRGIQRILDKMLTDAMLEEHIKKKGKLPKKSGRNYGVSRIMKTICPHVSN